MKKLAILAVAAFATAALLSYTLRKPTPALSPECYISCFESNMLSEFQREAGTAEFTGWHISPRPFVYEDQEGKMISFATPDGKEGAAYFVKAKKKKSNKYLVVIQEWWGLNDYIKSESDWYWKALDKDVNVIAVDMYDGKVAATADSASKLVRSVNNERLFNILKGAMAYAGTDAEIYTVGWCFGGGWSLQASITAGAQGKGCIMFYGRPETNVERLKLLNADVIGFFGDRDKSPSPEMVDAFEKNMQTAGKKLETHRYDAGHGFANPSNPNFNKEATADAKEKAIAFLKSKMKG